MTSWKYLIIPAIALVVVIIYDECMQANNAKGSKVVGASNILFKSVVHPAPQNRRKISKRRTNPPSHSNIAQSHNRKTTKSKRTRQTKKNVPKAEHESKRRRYTQVPKMVRAWKKYRVSETKYPGLSSCIKINCRRHAQCKGKGRAQKCNACNLYMRKCTPFRGKQHKGAKCTNDRECSNSVCDIRPGPVGRGGALDKVCQLWNGRKVDYKPDWSAARVKELYKIHGRWPNDPRTYISEKYEDRHLNKIAKDKHGMVFVFRESDVKILHHQIKKHGPRQAFGSAITEESIAEHMPVYKNGIPVISGTDAIKLRKWATKPADAVEELGLSPWIGSHSSSELRFVRIPPGHVMRSNLRLLNGNENGINRGMFEPGGRAPRGAHFRMAKLDWYPYELHRLYINYVTEHWNEPGNPPATPPANVNVPAIQKQKLKPDWAEMMRAEGFIGKPENFRRKKRIEQQDANRTAEQKVANTIKLRAQANARNVKKCALKAEANDGPEAKKAREEQGTAKDS